MNSYKFIILLPFIFIFEMCANQKDRFDADYILGEWKVEKWTIESTNKIRTNKMDMHFKSDDSYIIDYGPENEEGRYWISGSYLHTFEKNESEKKVLILKLVSDTLEIQMNRAGEMENVLLLKK